MMLIVHQNESDPFTYSCLPDTDTNSQYGPHIRLLEVHESESSDKTPQISIHRTSVENAPSYQAISYVWGGEEDEERIYVKHADSSVHNTSGDERIAQDGYMIVQKNCADVLRQLQHFKFSKYYWIDAICINQTDAREKSTQVAQMGGTFKSAEAVLVCIGMHYDNSRLAALKLREFENFLAERGTSIITLTDRSLLERNGYGKLSQEHRADTTDAKDRHEKLEICKRLAWTGCKASMTRYSLDS